jgi:tetratricopeptide (TPR) repeat protein
MHYRQERKLDPFSGQGLGEALFFSRHYSEALETIQQAIVLSPLNLQLFMDEVNIDLAQGDLAAAKAVLHQVPPGIDAARFVAYMATAPIDYDVSWALDGAQREILLGTTPQEFGGDRGEWALCLAVASLRKGDLAKTRVYAEEARRNLEELRTVQPRNYRVHSGLGLALAMLGRKEEAIREGERATALNSADRNLFEGEKALSNLVRIRILVGDYERAIDDLERVVKLPQHWTPGLLRIDPDFDPIRNNPRFQKLVVGA